MGIFDKVDDEAENLDPNLAQQAGQPGGQVNQGDMQTAQNTLGQQGGYQDQDPNQGSQDPNQQQGGDDQDQDQDW